MPRGRKPKSTEEASKVEEKPFRKIGVIGSDKWTNLSQILTKINETIGELNNCELVLLTCGSFDIWVIEEAINRRIPYSIYTSKYRNIAQFKNFLKRAKQVRIAQDETKDKATRVQIKWFIDDCDEFIIMWNGDTSDNIVYSSRQQIRKSGKEIIDLIS